MMATLQSLTGDGDTMADLDAQFEQAQADVKTLSSKPSNDNLLILYALFKQGTVGDATGAKKPGRFDLVGKAKYEAWRKAAGTSADEAKNAIHRRGESTARSLIRLAARIGRVAISPQASGPAHPSVERSARQTPEATTPRPSPRSDDHLRFGAATLIQTDRRSRG
jgi:acyl-CoA-binding protein